MNIKTIGEYYQKKKEKDLLLKSRYNEDWKISLRNKLFKAIDDGLLEYVHCNIFFDLDYDFHYCSESCNNKCPFEINGKTYEYDGKVIITKIITNLIDFIEEEGLDWYLRFDDSNNRSNDHGQFIIKWDDY